MKRLKYSLFLKKRFKKGNLVRIIGTIILSALGLLLIMKVFFAIFLISSTNLTIAKDNMNSISKFITFSKDRFDNKNNVCSVIFRLHNLNSYQSFSSNKKNYIYIFRASASGIFLDIFSLKDFSALSVKLSLNKGYDGFKPIKSLRLDGVDSLRLIKVNKGSLTKDFLNMFLPWNMLNANFKDKMNIDEKVDYYVLVPKDSAQNRYEVYYMNTNLNFIKDLGMSSNLVYIPIKKILFITTDNFEDLIVGKSLCSYEKVISSIDLKVFVDESGNLINLNKFDFLNNEYVIKVSDNVPSSCNYKFVWNSGPECYEDGNIADCYKLVGIVKSSNYNFKNFYSDVKNFYKSNPNCNVGSDNLYFSINEKERSLKEKNLDLPYEKFLNSLDINGKSVDIFKWSRAEKHKENVYSLGGYCYDSMSSNVNPTCDVLISNGNVYYYSGTDKDDKNRYSSFNVKFLRKKIYNVNGNFELYLGNLKLTPIKEKYILADRYDTWKSVWHLPGSDNYRVYIYSFKFKNSIKFIYLTQQQLNKIPVLK